MDNHYTMDKPKNLHDRIISESGDTVTFRDFDGQPEQQKIVKDFRLFVLVCSDSGDWLYLWRD